LAKPFSIVVPTYKEYDNIGPLVRQLGEVLAGRQYEILLIDDNSQDGTEEEVADLSTRYPVRIVVRKGVKGLATAVLDGFGLARYDTILVMDADLQHPPEIAPLLIDAIENGADAAVASRYVPGGGNIGWSKLRQITSQGAIMMAHLLLPLSRKVKDPMSGFFAFKRELLRDIKLNPIGYKILLEIIVIARPQKVVEVPFMFRTREKGKSKLNVGQEMEYIKHLLSLMRRSGELTRFIKFLVVGGSGIVVNEGLLWLMKHPAGLSLASSLIIAIETSIISNFIFNNYFTFADCRMPGFRPFIVRLLKFNVFSLPGGILNFATTMWLTDIGGPYYLAFNLVGIALAMLWNFFANNWWTWKR
jgi:dolichol-phosphate mannosyltransferase